MKLSLHALPVLVRATKEDRNTLVYALNKYGGMELPYGLSADELARQLAIQDPHELIAALRQTREHYGEKLPILEKLAVRWC
jgi:hypothetical protein